MQKRKLKGEKLSPSEQQVRCRYPECKFYGGPDTFKIHNNRRHEGHQNARVKNSRFDPGAKLASYAPLPQVSGINYEVFFSHAVFRMLLRFCVILSRSVRAAEFGSLSIYWFVVYCL